MNLKKLEKVLICQRNLFKKIAIMHGKGEFSKTKGKLLQHYNKSGNRLVVLKTES